MNLFISSVEDPANAYYAWVGRPYPWTDDNNPPDAVATVADTEQSIYTDLVYGKLITADTVKPVIPRTNWVANTVFTAYDQNEASLYTNSNFYVFTDENAVYKCIYNADGAASTVKPTLTATTGVFETSDGYIWKYMYTIDSTSMERFSSNNYLVVLPNTSVEAAASPGAIDYIKTAPSGQNYTAVSTGYLANYVNTSVVEISANASSTDHVYTNSAIYLYSGPGANQIRNIRHYDGLNKLVYVDELLDSYVTAQVANVSGSVLVGQTLVQTVDAISILYKVGYFNVGDVVTQTDSGVTGTVVSSNSSVIGIQRNQFVTPFSLNLSVYNTNSTGPQKTGNVSIVAASANVIGVGTQFTDSANGYVAGEYIRVGDAANNNVRRILTVTNSTHLIVNTVFTQTLSANIHFKVPSAFETNSITVESASGVITHTNFSGITLEFSNNLLSDVAYIPGELVTMVDASNIDQGANGTVAFANTTTLILSDVTGTFSNTYFVYGKSSVQKSNIDSILSFPSITIETTSRRLASGQSAYSFNDTSGSPVGNLNITSSYSIPNQFTLYTIAPSVHITGDGTGAKAYAVVNTAAHSVYGIDSIQMIDGGENYTYADVTVVANNLYGSGVTANAVIGPILGHGANTYLDLGARYACISTKFDTFVNELYKLPSSGDYRKLGVIKNPLWDNVVIGLNPRDRTKLTTASTSGTFETNEIIRQASSNAVGVVVFSNSTFVEISSSTGTFTANASGDSILGISSAATANVKFANTVEYAILSNAESVVQETTGATGIIEQLIDANTLKLTSVQGLLANSYAVLDPVTNAHAKVISIATSNGLVDASSGFGLRFNQSSRLSLSSNTLPFALYETITQDVTEATGRVFDMDTDLDLIFGSANGSFAVGSMLTDSNTSATATVLAANSTYLKLTNVTGVINVSDSIINNFDVGASITAIYPVLKLYDLHGTFQIGSYALVGNTSLASGQISYANTVSYPDLVRNSGEVLYVENIAPLTKSAISTEIVRLVLKF